MTQENAFGLRALYREASPETLSRYCWSSGSSKEESQAHERPPSEERWPRPQREQRAAS